MADHGSDARRHQFVGRCDRLLRIAVVVDDHQLEPLAENAAGRVQLGDARFHPTLHLLAEPSHAAGHRAGGADQGLGAGDRSVRCRQRNQTYD